MMKHFMNFLGYHLIVYYTEENDERSIVFFYRTDDKTSVVRIDAENIEKYSDFTLFYYNGRKTAKIKNRTRYCDYL